MSRVYSMLPICHRADSLVIRTSGLDASIALGVMHVLRDIAATGRTVIGTVASLYECIRS